MKWFAYPVAIAAYLIYASLLVAGIYKGFDFTGFWGWACITGAVFLLSAFVLSKTKLSDELKVAAQLALVLGPLIYLVNQKDSSETQVRVFVVPAGYTGQLQVRFSPKFERKEKSKSDTVRMYFDSLGRIGVSEDYRKVISDMVLHLYYKDSTGKMTPVPFASLDKLPADTSKVVLVQDGSVYDDGHVKTLNYVLDKPHRIPARLKTKK